MEKKIERRGRQVENDTIIEVYTQEFKDHTGEIFIWNWDKTQWANGPLSVEVKDPNWANFDRKEKQLSTLLSKYEVNGKGRKPRITKVDKIEIETLEKEINEIWYGFFPEDAQKVRKPRTSKIK